MSAHLVLAAMVLGSISFTSHAQATSTLVLSGVGCPVAFSASREGALLARARTPFPGSNSGADPAALVNVHFARASVAQIVEVQGSVYGATAAPHFQQTSDYVVDTAGPQARHQFFQLTGFGPNAPALDWKLSVRVVPVIQGVRFTQIRLSDGTVWHESEHSHCVARVGGLLPVSVTSSSAASSPR